MKLTIFDIDGTITDRDSTDIYPGATALIRSLSANGSRIALATNQGGPACHDAGWSFSQNFPSLEQVQERLSIIKAQVESLAGQEIGLFACYAYKSKSGEILLPANLDPTAPEASPAWRKPQPGMLLAALAWADARPDEAAMWGDSAEDEDAAKLAGIEFNSAPIPFLRSRKK